ncbi:MAG TPA: Calx-beta domain-containing protein, partial [Clostridia bacterium]|nr:Calx-beta domain-containing protein [Clostridia bacterium]
PGVLGFEVSSFSVNEGTNAVITVTRTNGSYGSASIQFATANGTALSGVDYYATNGTMNFVAGQTNKSFMVRLLNNFNVQPVDRTVNLRLFNANSATMGLTNAVLSLVDDDYPPGFVNFAGAAVSTNEAAGTITLTVRRSGGSSGTLTVQCGTTNGTAINGTHYLGLTNTLTWNPGDSTPRYVTVPLIDNAFVGGSTFFTVSLFDAKVNTAPAPTVLGGAFTRTTVNILEDDGYGTVQFSAPQYKVNENGGVVTLTVVRTSGSAETVRVNYSTADGSAVSSGVLPNYLPTAGSLTLAPDEVAKSFDVVLLHDGLQNGSPFFFTVQLTDESPAGVLGPQSSAVVNIVDAESYNEPPGALDTIFDPVPGFNADIYSLALQPDGQILAAGAFTRVNSYQRNRVVRLNADASLDNSFMDGLGGANAPVRTMLLQSDGRVVVGGEFTFMNGVVRNRLARLVSDGNLDTSFDPGSGADGSIFALAESFVGGNRQLLVGGNFITVNGLPREGLARLKNDGAIDPDFNPTLVIRGSVYAIAVYPTNTIQAGKILVAGDFSSVEGVARGGIARLNPNGTLDGSFDPGTGANGVVRALAIQPDGKVLLGGSFTNFNGQAINRLARLNVNGTMDSSFQTGTGANDTVEAITLQADNRIVVVGQFTAANGVSRRRITRLMQDGTPDPALNFGTGANGLISSVLVQPDGRILAGGGFTEYDGQARQRLARIYGGSVSGAGSIEFTDIEYQIEESSTNALITLRRRGGTSGKVTAQVVTSPITAIPGVNYSNVTAALTFPAGETFHSVVVPILDDLLITPDLSVLLTLQNVSAPATLGNIPFATLTIVNTDSTVTFSSPTYRVNENLVGGMANI